MTRVASVTLEEAGEAQASIIERLLQLYQYDFSEIEGGRIDDTGRYPYISPWTQWTTPDHHAFLVRVDGELAGLVLVKPAKDDRSDAPSRIVDEFFVMRKFRRRGIGRAVTRQLFDRLPGGWSLHESPHNYTAQAFWRTVLAEYTGGRFAEVVVDDRPTQRFQNVGGPDRTPHTPQPSTAPE